ncbi:MAG: hybrid sensor histidine kinase/response regulator [Magnetococcales bacterium]|nr:hybrid sensor histidine kinase/response regulator [Magnetococcales bacterium]
MSDPDQGEQKSVLIVDDSPESIDTMRAILSPFYRILVATNSDSALKAALSKTPPDLILLDIMMPNVDGYEVCRQLKQESQTKEIPILFVTAKTAVEDETKGFDLGAVDYLTKPVNRAIVLARVDTHISLYQRNSELAMANTRLKELDQLKSLFIASMSHELRTPLNSIIGFIGVMLQELTGTLNDRQKDHLGRAYASAKHLLALIVDVIDISKIEAGRLEIYLERIELDELVQEALATIASDAEKKGLEIISNYPETQYLITDRKRVLQCLLNYLSNAVKYTQQGRIVLDISVVDSSLQIAVTDSGIGIDREDISRLFESFVRLDATRKMNIPGTGLGLYLTKKIATDLLGGMVSVSSQVGVGSTFMLSIPLDLRPEGSGQNRGEIP